MSQISQQILQIKHFPGQKLCWLAFVELPQSSSSSLTSCGLNKNNISAEPLCTSTHSGNVGQYLYCFPSSFLTPQTFILYIHPAHIVRKPWSYSLRIHMYALTDVFFFKFLPPGTEPVCARWKKFDIQFPLLNGTFSVPAGSYPWLSRVSTVWAYSALIIKNKARNLPCLRKQSEFQR